MEKNKDFNKNLLSFIFWIVLIFISEKIKAKYFQISGGADGRYINKNLKGDDLKLGGLFLNVRKILSDDKGNKIILAGQIDADNNFEKIKRYQVYIQYKGPLLKWNIRVGHYILPFGLLFDYDTERLILKTMEDLSLGIKLDTGIELFGFSGDFVYAVSLSQGTWQNRLTDIDNDKLSTFRVGWEAEDISIGLSGLIGKVFTEKNSLIHKENGSRIIYEKRLGFDFTKYVGQFLIRGEILSGKDNNNFVGGGLL